MSVSRFSADIVVRACVCVKSYWTLHKHHVITPEHRLDSSGDRGRRAVGWLGGLVGGGWGRGRDRFFLSFCLMASDAKQHIRDNL